MPELVSLVNVLPECNAIPYAYIRPLYHMGFSWQDWKWMIQRELLRLESAG